MIGETGFEPATARPPDAREACLDVLGDLVTEHLDTERLTALIAAGAPAELPSIRTEVHPCRVS